MRYPVGGRESWMEAMDAARESSRMTGVRYTVRADVDMRSFRLFRVWSFYPTEQPGPQHLPVRV